MGLVTAITGVGTVLTGLFAGHLIDRLDRRRILIGCDLVRAGLHLLVPLVWLVGPQLWLLFVLAAVSSCLSMVFNVGYVTAVANLVEPDQVTAANGRLSATFAIGSILGPSLAGLLAATVGYTWALGVDGVSFLFSALGLYLIRFRTTVRPDDAGPDGVGVREAFLIGVHFLWRQPTLRSLTVLLGLVIFVEVGATDLLIFHLKHDLAESTRAVGLVLGLSGAGAIAGGILAPRLRAAYGFGACWLGSVLLMGVSITGFGVSRDVVLIAALAVLLTFGITVGGICSMSLRQQVTPDHLLGRVTSAFWAVHMAPGPVGAAAFTLLAARRGVPTAATLGGLCCLLIVAVGVFTPVRAAHPERVALRET
jgi:MFS family permease